MYFPSGEHLLLALCFNSYFFVSLTPSILSVKVNLGVPSRFNRYALRITFSTHYSRLNPVKKPLLSRLPPLEKSNTHLFPPCFTGKIFSSKTLFIKTSQAIVILIIGGLIFTRLPTTSNIKRLQPEPKNLRKDNGLL